MFRSEHSDALHRISSMTTEMRDIAGNLGALGARLRAERVRLGFNQADFAASGGVNRNSQTAYETGKTPPNVEYLLSLERIGVDVGFVLTGRKLDGSLGHLETQLLSAYREMRSDRREALLTVALALTDRAAGDMGSLSTIRAALAQETVHRSSLDYRALPKGEG
jgi:transcriptional regulator with XRE-family HTH domain